MYYVILSSPSWKPRGQWRGSIIHVEETRVLLRVGAIKHAICSLPLAPKAQRANLTLTSNPLTRKSTNARRVYGASDKQIHFFYRCVYVDEAGSMRGPFPPTRLPKYLLTPPLPISVPRLPLTSLRLHPSRWPPSNGALTPDVQFQCRLRDQLGWVCQWFC